MSRIEESLYRVSGIKLNESNLEINSDAKFREFLHGIHGNDTDTVPYRKNGWWYYQFKDPNGDINTFFCHAYSDDEAYDASYNKKFLADKLPKDHARGYFTSVQELISAYNKKVQTKNIKNEGNLASQLDMEERNTNMYGIHGDYARYTMSYGNGFKYDNLFDYDKQLTSYTKKLNKKFNFIPNGNVNKIWRYKNDPKILLVSLTKYHILTTEERFLSDLSKINSNRNL